MKQNERNRRNRVSVVVYHTGKILGFHAEDPHSKRKYFFLPGGVSELGETIDSTAIRETYEETGYSIKIKEGIKIFRRYDFEWNGIINDCHTWYLIGTLESLEQAKVNDADYHRGVDWIPIAEIDKVFGYHKDILEPIQETLEYMNVKKYTY